MDKRDKIHELIYLLNSLTYNDSQGLETYLHNVRNVIKDLFGEFNAYLTYVNCIRFYPMNTLPSLQENMRFWSQAKKELRDLLFVILDDPILLPSNQARSRVFDQYIDEEPVPRYAMDKVFAEALQSFHKVVNDDLALAAAKNAEASSDEQTTAEGPRGLSKVRVDLRDVSLLDNLKGHEEEALPARPVPLFMRKRLFFLPGSDQEANVEVLALLRRYEVILIEGEKVGPMSTPVHEQFARFNHVEAAVVVLSSDLLIDPKEQPSQQSYSGPSQSMCFALGYLVAKLGHKRVIAIYVDEDNLKRPTNYFEATYIAFDHTGLWQKEVALSLKELGMTVGSEQNISKSAA